MDYAAGEGRGGVKGSVGVGVQLVRTDAAIRETCGIHIFNQCVRLGLGSHSWMRS